MWLCVLTFAFKNLTVEETWCCLKRAVVQESRRQSFPCAMIQYYNFFLLTEYNKKYLVLEGFFHKNVVDRFYFCNRVFHVSE